MARMTKQEQEKIEKEFNKIKTPFDDIYKSLVKLNIELEVFKRETELRLENVRKQIKNYYK